MNHQFVLMSLVGDPGHHGGCSGARHRELQLSGQGQILRALDETPRNAWCYEMFRCVSASVRQLQVQMPSEVLQIFSPSHVEMECHWQGCKAGNGAVFANIFQFSTETCGPHKDCIISCNNDK